MVTLEAWCTRQEVCDAFKVTRSRHREDPHRINIFSLSHHSPPHREPARGAERGEPPHPWLCGTRRNGNQHGLLLSCTSSVRDLHSQLQGETGAASGQQLTGSITTSPAEPHHRAQSPLRDLKGPAGILGARGSLPSCLCLFPTPIPTGSRVDRAELWSLAELGAQV